MNIFQERGNALIIVLWLLALLGALTAAFALNATIQTQISDSITKMSGGYSLARAGLDAWMAQVRADSLESLDDVGVVVTEVMFYYPPSPVRINEVDPNGEKVEIYNASDDISVDVTGWYIQDALDNIGPTASGTLSPGEFMVLTSNGLNDGDDVVNLKNIRGQVMDDFTYTGWSAGTYQVLPDGWNGFKPAVNHSDSAGWIQSTNTNLGNSNGKGMWVKVGDGDTEGIKLEQYDEDGNLVNTFNFGTDITDPITPDDHFLRLSGDSGFLVVTNNLDGDSIANYYTNGVDDNDSSVQVINSGGAFPDFSDTDLITKVYVPQPEVGNVSWKKYAYSDSITKPADATLLDGHSEGKHYVVRVDTDPSGIRRGDSTTASPDPGSMRPAVYTGSASSYSFDDAASRSGKLYVSELIDTYSIDSFGGGSSAGHVVISEIGEDYGGSSSNDFVELYNPTDADVNLSGWSVQRASNPGSFSASDKVSLTGIIKSKGFYLVTDDGWSSGVAADDNSSNLVINDDDAIALVSNNTDVTGAGDPDIVDLVGFGASAVYEGSSPTDDIIAGRSLERKAMSSSTASDLESGGAHENWGNGFDSDKNDTDWIRHGSGIAYPQDTASGTETFPAPSADIKNQFVELILSGSPSIDFSDQNEFIEIYNTGASEDVTTGYTIEDTLDADGMDVSGKEYSIAMHPESPTADGTLAREQIGLILPVDADTGALGVSNLVDAGTVKLYKLQYGGSDQFLTGGLHNDEKEHIIFRRGTGADRTILDGFSGWVPDDVVTPKISMEKKLLDGDNTSDNWGESGLGGTPGQVPAIGTDNFTEVWGWGGELFADSSGIYMGDTVYLPSESKTYTDGDYGYFRLIDIQDESGKINLVEPPSVKALDTENGPTARTLSEAMATEVMDRNDTEWITTGDLMYISGAGVGVMDADEGEVNVYSVYRDGTDSQQININTAPYEALRSIQINSDTTTSPAFITDEMARAIIETRSGLTGTSAPTSISDVVALEREEEIQYMTGSGAAPFTDENTACGLTPMTADGSNFDCTIFKQYAKTHSDGMFRARVKGVPLTSGGQEGAQVTLEAVVDRSELIDYDTGALEVIYMRKN